MKGRKYIQNKQGLSDSEIEKLKDFDSITNRLDQGPGGQSDNGNSMNAFSGIGKGAIFFMVAAVAVWFAVTKLNKKEEVLVQENVVVGKDSLELTPMPKYIIEPPIQEVDVEYETFVIDAQEDAVLESKRGSEILIQKNTFLDSSGNLVQGELTIKYREFHNPFEIFKCGIPMHYDSSGTQYTFESAGMFDIVAEQNGKPVNKKLDKEIIVDLVTNNTSMAFNNYFFNDTKGEWVYQEKVAAVEIEAKSEGTLAEGQDVKLKSNPIANSIQGESEKKVQLDAPIAPPPFPKVLKEKYAFEVDYDLSKFPELRKKGVVFQVDDKLSNFSSIYYDVAWESVELKRSINANRYTVLLKKAGKTLEVECFPALTEKEYHKVQEEYKEKLEAYNKFVEENASNRSYRSKPKSREEQKVDKLLAKNTKEGRFRAKRRFVVENTGFYNSDCPRDLRVEGRQVLAVFHSNEGRLNVERTYNVIGKKNMLITSPKTEIVNYKKGVRNTFWVLTSDNKIAIADPKDFEEISGEKYVFNLKVYNLNVGLKILEKSFS